MIESEEHGHSIAEQKAKIRERYRGIDTSELDCIRHTPAATKALANGHFARASGHPRFGLIQQSL